MEAAVHIWHGPGMAKSPPAENPESLTALGRRLELVQIASGESEAEFCRQLGVTQQNWQHYVKARRRIARDVAGRLHRMHGVDWNYIEAGIMTGLAPKVVAALRTAETTQSQKRRRA